MAGQIEDQASFQADGLPTDSISFGRFEVESLSWERRSSFSHNRYLEEVEKYSTPGSVTQKKAYFEAQLKNKPLLRQASSESQNEMVGRTEKGIEEQMTCMEEFKKHGNEGPHFKEFGDHGDEGIQFSWYDETPDFSDGQEVMEAELVEETPPSELPIEATLSSDKTLIGDNVLLIECVEKRKTQSEFDTIPLVSDDKEVVVEENSAAEVENVDAESKKTSVKSPTAEKASSSTLKKPMPKAKVTMEHKPSKLKLRMQAPAAQIPQKISAEKSYLSSRRTLAGASKKIEKQSLVKTKAGRQSPSRGQPPTCSTSKNLTSKGSENVKVKEMQGNKSEKDLKEKKIVAPQSIYGKGQFDVRQSANRPKRVINVVKSEMKTRSAVFSFKSDERALKRKEFYMKLDEKLHAKEFELIEIQAKTQKETEAEMKQFRRSLNFKATPMPSFYHEAGTRVSDAKKAVNPHTKSPKLQSKFSSLGSKAVPRGTPLAPSQTSNPQGSSSRKQPGTIQQDCRKTSEGGTASSKLANGPDKTGSAGEVKRESQPDKKTLAGKKEGKPKVNLQQQQGDSKLKRGDIDSKARRSSEGKVIKGMVGRSVAVHVAS